MSRTEQNYAPTPNNHRYWFFSNIWFPTRDLPPSHLAGATPVGCLARLPVPQTGFCACLARGGWAFCAGSRCGFCTESCQTGAGQRRITGTAPSQLAAAPHRGAPLQALWPARPVSNPDARGGGGPPGRHVLWRRLPVCQPATAGVWRAGFSCLADPMSVRQAHLDCSDGP